MRQWVQTRGQCLSCYNPLVPYTIRLPFGFNLHTARPQDDSSWGRAVNIGASLRRSGNRYMLIELHLFNLTHPRMKVKYLKWIMSIDVIRLYLRYPRTCDTDILTPNFFNRCHDAKIANIRMDVCCQQISYVPLKISATAEFKDWNLKMNKGQFPLNNPKGWNKHL